MFSGHLTSNMRVAFAIVVIVLVFQCEAAKRVKMCDTSNAESPGKSIYLSNCYTGATYKCLDGDASNKGKWQNCQHVSSPWDDVRTFGDRWCGNSATSDKEKKIIVFAYGGNDSDGLCVEAIDYEDVLTTFCDDVSGEDHIMSKGAGWCETFGWGGLREYQRLWFDDGSGRCNGFIGTSEGSNGQEFKVYKTMCAWDSLN